MKDKPKGGMSMKPKASKKMPMAKHEDMKQDKKMIKNMVKKGCMK